VKELGGFLWHWLCTGASLVALPHFVGGILTPLIIEVGKAAQENQCGDFVVIDSYRSKEPTMTQRFLSVLAVMLALLMSNAATAQARNDVAASVFAWVPSRGHYQYLKRCVVWDGYQWLNMCWRSRTFVRPAWARFQR
jgi:hypothetical protein